MVKKNILFDLDGTLTDSGEGIMNCAELAFRTLGYPVPCRKEMRTFVGPPLRESFVRHGIPEQLAEKAIEIYRQRYLSTGKYENFPYPGMKQLLQMLKEEGHSLYVATSKPEQLAQEILEHFGLSCYFNQICGASLDSSRDSKAKVISAVLQSLDPSVPVIMVGDTKYDVCGAAVHGIPAVCVSWGYGIEEEMLQAGAKAIAHTMEELHLLLNA